jgi:hypothetical protein
MEFERAVVKSLRESRNLNAGILNHTDEATITELVKNQCEKLGWDFQPSMIKDVIEEIDQNDSWRKTDTPAKVIARWSVRHSMDR